MQMKKKNIKAIILAGGYSKRMKLNVPKQMLKIDGKPLIAHTLDVFQGCRAINSIILVAHKRLISQCSDLIKKGGYKKVEQIVAGGKTRQQSVFNALKKVKDCDYVLIHDGVRPFVSRKVILELLKAVKRSGAVTCAVGAIDTIADAKAGFIHTTLTRGNLWHIQTPQAFSFNLILNAHLRARAKKILNAGDDTQLALKFGNKVEIVKGSYQNLKITTPFDLCLAKLILEKK
jgi:2-C-methyl-D-erythritol 4-phosphate cytidylyltransferase